MLISIKTCLLFLVSLTLLVGCTNNKNNFWHLQTINGVCFKSQKIYHTPCKENFTYEPEFEIIKNSHGIRAYLNVLSNTAFSGTDDRFVEAYLVINNATSQKFNLKRLTGGQRLMLPNDVIQKIIINLRNKNECYIYFNDYHIHLKPSNFDDLWFYQKPLINLPTLFKTPH